MPVSAPGRFIRFTLETFGAKALPLTFSRLEAPSSSIRYDRPVFLVVQAQSIGCPKTSQHKIDGRTKLSSQRTRSGHVSPTIRKGLEAPFSFLVTDNGPQPFRRPYVSGITPRPERTDPLPAWARRAFGSARFYSGHTPPLVPTHLGSLPQAPAHHFRQDKRFPH